MFDLFRLTAMERNLFNYLDNVGPASGMAAFPIWHSSAAMYRTKATAICWRQSCRAFERGTSALIWTVQRLLSRRATAAKRAEKGTKTVTICAWSASSARSAAAFDISGVDTEYISAAYKTVCWS